MRKRTAKIVVKSLLVMLMLVFSTFMLIADEGESFTIEVKSKGKGKVTLTPEGGEYPAGTEVTVTAVAEKGFTFANWDEDLEGFELTKTVVVEEDLEIEALFKRSYRKGTVQNTDYGKVKGQREVLNDPLNSNIDFDVLAWRGLPYAAPPVGELRWKAPRELESWRGVRYAVKNGEPSPQFDIFSGQPTGSEDCLYLNVFRPNTAEEGLPVYFWIHGGGNVSGHAGEYDHIRNFADRTNSIVVVIQYRLANMGVFYNPLLEGDELDRSGNFVLLDQIKALKWVRDNIDYFGGNPSNVTIGGESAGAHNVLGLMVTPLAKGLFHKAVYQSGGMFYITKERALQSSQAVIEALKLKKEAGGAAFEDDEELLEMLEETGAAEFTGLVPPTSLYSLVIDGVVIPEDPMKMLAEGNYNRVPIVIGGCKDELNMLNAIFFPPIIKVYNEMNGTNIPDYSRLVPLIATGQDLSTVYTQDELDSFIKACSVISRLAVFYHVQEVAARLRKHQDDVYMYTFNWDSDNGSAYQQMIGATHAADIPFFQGGSSIDMWKLGPAVYTESSRLGRQELERVMSDQIGSFIYSGAPNSPELPLWEPLVQDEIGFRVMVLDSRDSNNTGDPAFSMVEKLFDSEALAAEGMGYEATDRNAFDLFMLHFNLLKASIE